MNESNRRLSILHLIFSAGETNGQYNEHCLPMAHKRNITICTYLSSKNKPPAEIALFDGDSSLRGFFRALKAALDEGEYDVIHAHDPVTGVLLLAAMIMYGRYGTLVRSTVYTVQNSYQNYKFRNRMMLIPIFAFFQRLVLCSHAAYESLPVFIKWLGGDRVHIVQNAVDIDRVDRMVANTGGTNHNGHFTIASVGRLIDIKNPLSLLMAFQQSNDQASNLVFVGEGNLRARLASEIKEQGLSRQVKTTGLIGRDEVYAHLDKADLFVSTSRGEGLPVAVIEAMACRCPVILSDIPPHREIAQDVDFIPLLQPDDVAGFAREIKRFRQMSPVERVEIGEKCRTLVEERFSLTTMHNGLEEVYAQLPGVYL
jgi:glycosyltransferase involved in cell wall biosynthesis